MHWICYQKKEEYDKLIADGYENIVYTDRTKIDEELHAIPDTASFHQVSNFPDNPINEHQLKSNVLSCSCIKCRTGSNCSFHVMRQSATHAIKLKQVFQSQSDDCLKEIDISKLTIPRLKTELLSRSLSTSHKVKSDLVNRLQNYLTTIVLNSDSC